MSTTSRVAVVTGANRGIGLETSRRLAHQGLHVILGSRDLAKGERIAAQFRQQGLTVTPFQLDVTNVTHSQRLADFLQQEIGRVDILINNAGIMIDSDRNSSVLQAQVETLQKSMETNVYGALRLCQRLIPLMQERHYGRIVNVSSGMGQLSDMNGGYAGYRLSKVSLNALTRIFADELQGTNILINSVCPGWVKTEMGGAGATRSVEQGAETLVWLATLPDHGPSGGFFRDKKRIDW